MAEDESTASIAAPREVVAWGWVRRGMDAEESISPHADVRRRRNVEVTVRAAITLLAIPAAAHGMKVGANEGVMDPPIMVLHVAPTAEGITDITIRDALTRYAGAAVGAAKPGTDTAPRIGVRGRDTMAEVMKSAGITGAAMTALTVMASPPIATKGHAVADRASITGKTVAVSPLIIR